MINIHIYLNIFYRICQVCVHEHNSHGKCDGCYRNEKAHQCTAYIGERTMAARVVSHRRPYILEQMDAYRNKHPASCPGVASPTPPWCQGMGRSLREHGKLPPTRRDPRKLIESFFVNLFFGEFSWNLTPKHVELS